MFISPAGFSDKPAERKLEKELQTQMPRLPGSWPADYEFPSPFRFMDFLFFLFPQNESPEGLWMRTGDQFAGCVLKVEKSGTELAGRIVNLPETMARVGWIEGELKWRNLRCEAGTWRLEDVRKHFDIQTGAVKMVDYCSYNLTLGSLGHLRLHRSKEPFYPDQRWVRHETTPSPTFNK